MSDKALTRRPKSTQDPSLCVALILSEFCRFSFPQVLPSSTLEVVPASFSMRILILSQVYWPDTASTAQHLADLGRELVIQGHEVTVLASRHAYEHTATSYAAEESHEGVKIQRLQHTGFGKGAIWMRLLDFGTFNLAMLWHLVWWPASRSDVVLGMTSPPLVSFLGSLVSGWKGWGFCYWAMDLPPELAIEAGLVRKGSLGAKALEFMGSALEAGMRRMPGRD